MEYCIFKKIGIGFILNDYEYNNLHNILDNTNFRVVNETLVPNNYTTLSNFFDSPVLYAGELKDRKNAMAFYLGFDEDLFEKTHYFQCLYHIANDRIFTKYTEYSGRDYNFIDNKWK